MACHRHTVISVRSLLALACVGCASTPTGIGGEVPQGILDFVATQSLPPVQSIGISFRDGKIALIVFAAAYGPAQDCPSGCFYDTAVGLQVGGRIGWWKVPSSAGGSVRYFDIRVTDKVLFDAGFLGRFKAGNPNLYPYFANYLACDPDTPATLLQSLRAEAKRFELTCSSAD